MAITLLPPNTIYLDGPRTEIGDVAASEAICPGMLVDRFNSAGVWRYRKHATAGGNTQRAVATEQSMLNKNVNEGYAANDLMEVSELAGGSNAWMLIASGQSIVAGQKLESDGAGMLRAIAAGTALFAALETVNNTTGSAGPTNPPPPAGVTTALPTGAARIRVEVV
jgi:hypothetical protein